MKVRDKETGEIFIVDDETGDMRPAGESLNFSPFGLDTGIEMPEGISMALASAGNQLSRMGSNLDPRRLTESQEAGQARYADQLAMEADRARMGESNPGAAFVGDMLPGLATLPLGLGRGALQVGANVLGQGAAFGVAGKQADDSYTESALGGALTSGAGFGVGKGLGEVLNRSGITGRLGNVWNAIQASGDNNIAQIVNAGRDLGLSKTAKEIVDLGGEVTPGIRYGSKGLRTLESGLQKDPVARKFFDDIGETNQRVQNEDLAKAVGLSTDMLEDGKFSPNVYSTMLKRFDDGFQSLTPKVGEIQLSTDAMDLFSTTRGFKRGWIKGIDKDTGIIPATKYNSVRRAVTEEIQKVADQGGGGAFERTQDLAKIVDELDDKAAAYLTPEEVEDFSRLREQYRVSKLINKNTVNMDGDVSAPNMVGKLSGEFGNTFDAQMVDRVKPETARLFDSMRTFSKPSARPIVGTSGTGENANAQNLIGTAMAALRGDVTAMGDLLLLGQKGRLYAHMAKNHPEALLNFIERGKIPTAFQSKTGAVVGRQSELSDD
jgi:hypothetical protein